MSVRRLAKEQPASFAFSKATKAKCDWWIAKYPADRRQSAVIPILWLVQKQEGWVSEPAIRAIGELLGMPYIRVLEVATFYTMFMLEPVGSAALIQVCGTTPCMLRGAEDLIHVCKSKIHPEPFERNAEGTLSWEEVECQGACVNAPMVMIFKDAYEDLTVTQLEHIIDRFAAGKGSDIKPGPQVDRIFSAPVGGPTTLTDDADALRSAAVGMGAVAGLCAAGGPYAPRPGGTPVPHGAGSALPDRACRSKSLTYPAPAYRPVAVADKPQAALPPADSGRKRSAGWPG